jgi:hypothetical protein
MTGLCNGTQTEAVMEATGVLYLGVCRVAIYPR